MKKRKVLKIKKAQGISINVIIIACIALIVLVILIAVFTGGFDKFNPEEDVCEGQTWAYHSGKLFHNLGSDYSCWWNKSMYQKFKEYPSDTYWFDTICCEKGNWRPKNKCELDVNAEGCVCDEKVYDRNKKGFVDALLTYQEFCEVELPYYRMKFNESPEDELYQAMLRGSIILCQDANRIIEQNYKTCISSHMMPTPIKIDLEKEKCVEHIKKGRVKDIYGTFASRKFPCGEVYSWWEKDGFKDDNNKYGYDKYCCLRKEPKNECEKNNPEYIEYCTTCIMSVTIVRERDLNARVNCEIRDCNINDTEKFCRKKTIQDYTCKELKKLIKERDCEGRFDKHICLRWGKGFDRLDKKYIVEYIERCKT